MKRKISALLCCAFILTSCAAPSESQPTSEAQTTSAVTEITSGTEQTAASEQTEPEQTTSEQTTSEQTTAATSTAASEPVTEQPAEADTAESVEDAETVAPETAEAPVQTEATTAATTTIVTAAATTTTVTTSATTTAATTTTVATTTTAAEPEEEPEPAKPVFPAFEYDNSAALRMKEYGVDTAAQEERYAKLAEETKLPIIHVSTEGEQPIMSREEYNNCLVDMFNCDEEYMLQAREGGIKIRGNSTAYYGDPNQVLRNQVPYRIKFDKKTNMMGLNDGAECKSWVLLKATWQIMPDYIAFQFAETLMKDEYYSSDCTFVYVYVNRDFKGLYLLCEQNQVNPNRVDLPEHDEGYTGTDIGYFYEIDNYAEEDPYWFTVDYCGETLTDLEGTERALVSAEYSIKNDIYSQEQVDFIAAYTNNVYKLMVQAIKYGRYYEFDADYQLVEAQDKYSSAYECINAEVDLDSVVNMYILYEITHDYDCGEGSFYMARDFSGKSSFDRLTFTAPWDFNWAYSDSPVRKYYAGAFNADSFVNQYGDRSNPWFILLMSTDWFTEMVKERWQELYNAGEITGTLDACNAYLKEYWDDLEVPNMYWSNNAQELLKWVRNRLKWLNMEWGSES